MHDTTSGIVAGTKKGGEQVYHHTGNLAGNVKDGGNQVVGGLKDGGNTVVHHGGQLGNKIQDGGN